MFLCRDRILSASQNLGPRQHCVERCAPIKLTVQHNSPNRARVANVDERVYNRLEVGSPATFRPLQDGKTYHGTVINLTGAAGAPANFAIAPINLRKSPFYVTIAMDDMGAAGCSIGRTGTVAFGDNPADYARGGSGEIDPHLRGSISGS